MISCYSRIAIGMVLLGPFVSETEAQVDAEDLVHSTVTGITAPRDGYPDISPDGERIVFQSNRSGTWQLWIVNVDGTGLLRLTHSGANDTSPVWSPDGIEIMFASDRAGGEPRDFDPSESYDARDVFVMDVSGGFSAAEDTVRRIVADPADDMHPEWIDGGRSIVLNRVYETGDGSDIVILDPDGGNERVARTPRGWNTYAAMTPDGKRLLWRGITEEMRDGETVANSDIYMAMRDGSDRVRLTNNPAFDGWPAISPDGEEIAFASNRGESGVFHLYLMATDGTDLRQITQGIYNYTQPAWSADGRSLAAFRWIEDDAGEIGHIVIIDHSERSTSIGSARAARDAGMSDAERQVARSSMPIPSNSIIPADSTP